MCVIYVRMIYLSNDATHEEILSHYPPEIHPLVMFLIERKILQWFDLRMILEQIDDLPAYLVNTLTDYLTIFQYAGLHARVLKQRKPYFDFMFSGNDDIQQMLACGEITPEGEVSAKIQEKLKLCGIMDAKGEIIPCVFKAREVWSFLFE